MVKRPGLGKRKRVTLPKIEASQQREQPERPEQQDELPDTQASVSDPRIQPPRPPSQRTQTIWTRPPKTASPTGGTRRGW